MGNRVVIAIIAGLIVAGLSVLAVSGSSHNDAPLISEDPTANNTDVYAFVSQVNPDMVTIIANYIPMVEPGDGPTYKNFSDQVLYEIMVDTNGDAREDVTYQFEFSTIFGALNPNTFLYNIGPIGPPPGIKPLPTAQYTNLNVHQSYTLTEVEGDRKTGKKQVLLPGVRVAPAHIGPVSTPSYDALADLAIHSYSFGGDIPAGKAFAGPRDEGFYVDLMAAFDLLGGFTTPSRPPVDTFSGFNVHTVALEIPLSRFGEAGDTDGIIGVWATASRQRIRVIQREGEGPRNQGPWVQVSRLGMPLVNELLLPFTVKDRYNASEPRDDKKNIADFIVNPGQQSAGLVSLLNTLTNCTPVSGRSDLKLIFLTGIPDGVLSGFPGNMDTQHPGGPVPSDMLRLNYNVPPTASPNPLGLLGGDPAGFPNGRRVGDDVVDVALKGAAGGVLQALGGLDPDDCNPGVAPLDLTDGVDNNDVLYLTAFPYLGTPHQGYDHKHRHGAYSMTTLTMGIGSGLLVGGILLGAVFAVRNRRQPLSR